MHSKNNFKRFFMIFEQEDSGYGIAGKMPSGHLKVEVRDGKGKLEGCITGLTDKSNYKYKLYLVYSTDRTIIPVDIEEITPSGNAAKVNWDFNPENVSGSNKSIYEFNVAALLVYSPITPVLAWPLVAYREKKVNWKNEATKALNHQYFKQPEGKANQRQPVAGEAAISERPKPKNVMPKPINKPVEIKQLKTTSNKYYINPDKTFSVEVASSPVNFKNWRGKLEDIDNELIRTNEPGYSYTNKENSLKVFFADNNNNGKLVRLKIDNNRWIDFSPNETFSIKGSMESSSIDYSNVGNSTELNYYVDGNRLKEEIIFIQQPPSNHFDFNIATFIWKRMKRVSYGLKTALIKKMS